MSYETICGEEIPWDRFCHGYAKKWAEVPWGCIEHYKTKDEIVEMFGKEIAEELEYTFESEALKAEQSKDTLLPGSTIKLARLFEIWDKEDKKRIILAQGYDDVLDESDDPLELDGFYPWPEPMSFFLRISGLTPQLLYKVYENQAKELNRVTIRINRIIEALKVRGFYDGSIDGLKALLTSDDNTLLPVQNVDKLEGKSLDNVLWFMPLSELVGVLQQCYVARKQIKGVIFELTGIADIMRGDTAASETLGAQQIKSQWGSMRLRQMQKEAARYARDYLRLTAEMAVTKLSQQTIQRMTNLPYPTNQDRAVAQQQLGQLQQTQVLMQQQAQMNPEAAQSPEMKQGMEQMQQQMSQLQEQIAGPTCDIVTGKQIGRAHV